MFTDIRICLEALLPKVVFCRINERMINTIAIVTAGTGIPKK